MNNQPNPGDLFKSVKGRNTVDFMLKTNRQLMHQQSSMADQKSSIILGAQTIVLTILFGQFQGVEIRLWLIVLGFFTLISAVASLLALMPSIKKKKPTVPRPPNLLFFGSIAWLDEDDYVHRMIEFLNDDSQIYEAIVRDLYQESLVLTHKKYRYLRYSYLFFVSGLIVSFFVATLEWLIR